MMTMVALECKYVTEERVREWKTANFAPKLRVGVPLDRFIYELSWTVVRGDLPLSKCKVALDAVELLEGKMKDGVASQFADSIAHMGQELTLPGELRNRLIELAKWLVDTGLVPVKLFQERCEAEFLWEAELIKIKAPDLKSKEVRVNTRLLYQQTKFNLLREESEGYAKLLTLLNQAQSDEQTSPTSISTLKSLIGHFDLDPNRVFDIVLECYELHPGNKLLLELIPLFPKSHISHILGFKFQYYQRTEVEEAVPASLYRLTASLIKENYVDLDSIYVHLWPKDEDAFEQYDEISKRRIDEANRIGKINLAATGKDLMEEEKPGDVTVDLYAALDMEIEAVAERSLDLLSNQKLGLLDGFLFVDDWPHAQVLFDRLAPLNPVAHPQICTGLLRAIEKIISIHYKGAHRSTEPRSSSTLQVLSLIDLGKDVFQMLLYAGPYLHCDVILMQKVCRVLKEYYLSFARYQDERKDSRSGLREARMRVEDALGACLLPSLQLLPANPAVSRELWQVMSLLPYEARYRLYGEWEKDDEQIPVLLAARLTAKLDTRRILKRLAKENLKQLGRMVAKIAHANPMTVLRTIVHQIEAYKDMIAPVVDAFKYLTQLEYDVLEYVVLERLAQGGREKLKEDGLNLSDWLQSLASFWGHLCKKYPSMELRGLFQYIVNQLKKGESIELVILQELIQQMANVEYIENVTEDQLEAMCGGETLRFQATAFGMTRNNKALIKSTNRLRDALLTKDDTKLAIPFLLLIAQQRSNIITSANAPHIKMVSEQYDRCHGALLQFVDFLTVAVSPTTTYAQLVPTLDDLVHKYHIEPEVAFLIYRPVMRLFKPNKESSLSWPADTSKDYAKIEDNSDDVHGSPELILESGIHGKPLMWSELVSTVHSMLPSKSWNCISPELYLTFWGLTLHDLYVPRKRYEAEVGRQRAALKGLEESADNSYAAITKRKKDKEKIQEILDRLSADLLKQEQNVAAVHQRLVREKDSWLTSCPDTHKLNMEFLQRCIFPRCVFSMVDAVYCARFVQTLHSLGTPFFNTVNHIDCLICKILQPMICCCTEYEAGRLGRFLYETLKMAYHWKSNASIYEQECGNMPGFSILYRDPNSTRVTFQQYTRISWKWSNRLTRSLVQCLESSEYIEIRNALTVLTKISSIFPITKRSGVNIEKRVNKIKGDEREDLKVLATGVAAALASRKNTWMTDDEFGVPPARPLTRGPSSVGTASTRHGATLVSHTASENGLDNVLIANPDAILEREILNSQGKNKVAEPKVSLVQHVAAQQQTNRMKPASVELEYDGHASEKTSVPNYGDTLAVEGDDEMPVAKNVKVSIVKTEVVQDASNSVRGASVAAVSADKDSRHRALAPTPVLTNGATGTSKGQNTSNKVGARVILETGNIKSEGAISSSKLVDTSMPVEREKEWPSESGIDSYNNGTKSPTHREDGTRNAEALAKERQVKRSVGDSEPDRLNKRRKAEPSERITEAGEIRPQERDRHVDRRSAERARSADLERGNDRPRERAERTERDYRASDRNGERLERDRDDILDKPKDRSVENLAKERSADRTAERSVDWPHERKSRYSDSASEQPHPDDRYQMQNLPPPPPLPPNVIPESLLGGRRDEETDRRGVRMVSQMSPHQDEKFEKKRADEGRDRKRDERELMAIKPEKERERERERDKASILKDDNELAGSKRRKLRRDNDMPINFGLTPAPPLPPTSVPPQYDSRERDRKGGALPRSMYNMEEPAGGRHRKDGAKVGRRDHDPMYERDWDEEKRQRPEMKRHHRK